LKARLKIAKKVFSLDIGVEPSFRVLDIQAYACGSKLCLALIASENPNFAIDLNMSIARSAAGGDAYPRRTGSPDAASSAETVI
jgi:hypothetical protein